MLEGDQPWQRHRGGFRRASVAPGGFALGTRCHGEILGREGFLRLHRALWGSRTRRGAGALLGRGVGLSKAKGCGLGEPGCPGQEGGAAAAESRFCAARGAPVSLTLEPAAYLSNSKGNSAAAEGKKITSAAEQGGKRPHCPPQPCPAQRGPGTRLAAQAGTGPSCPG